MIHLDFEITSVIINHSVVPLVLTPQTNNTWVQLEANQDRPFQAVSVRLFGQHQDSTDSFHTGPNEPHWPGKHTAGSILTCPKSGFPAWTVFSPLCPLIKIKQGTSGNNLKDILELVERSQTQLIVIISLHLDLLALKSVRVPLPHIQNTRWARSSCAKQEF